MAVRSSNKTRSSHRLSRTPPVHIRPIWGRSEASARRKHRLHVSPSSYLGAFRRDSNHVVLHIDRANMSQRDKWKRYEEVEWNFRHTLRDTVWKYSIYISEEIMKYFLQRISKENRKNQSLNRHMVWVLLTKCKSWALKSLRLWLESRATNNSYSLITPLENYPLN